MSRRSVKMDRRANHHEAGKSGYHARYNHTSEAYQLDNEPYNPHSPKIKRKKVKKGSHAKVRAKERGIRREHKQAPRYEFLLHENPGHSIRMYFTILTLFVLCFALIHVSAEVSQKNAEKIATIEKIKQASDDLEYLKSELSYNIDEARITKEAGQKFGMHQPFDYQVVHINVPVTNKSVQYASAPVKESAVIDKSVLMKLINKIGIGE